MSRIITLFVKFLEEIQGKIQGTGYIHGFELGARGFKGTGYLVSRVWGTWFQRYWGTYSFLLYQRLFTGLTIQ